MSCDYQSLLPHATPLERALEEEASQKYCRLKTEIIRDIHDPWKCPENLLPWLAYALSVDEWNDGWDEYIKRSICANSVQIHRHKGTHQGVVDALELIGIKADITYWHETEPKGKKGTFDVTLWVNKNILPHADVILGSEVIQHVKRQIDSHKRASLHYTYRIGIKTKTQIGTGYSAQFSSFMYMGMKHNRIDIKPKATGINVGYSAQFSSFMYMGMKHNRIDIKPKATGINVGYSAQLSTMMHIGMVI